MGWMVLDDGLDIDLVLGGIGSHGLDRLTRWAWGRGCDTFSSLIHSSFTLLSSLFFLRFALIRYKLSQMHIAELLLILASIVSYYIHPHTPTC